MANFKISKKEFISDTRSTLDDLHEKKLKSFDLEQSQLGNLQNELLSLNNQLINTNNNQIRSFINEKIINLNEKIENIKNDTNRINYF